MPTTRRSASLSSSTASAAARPVNERVHVAVLGAPTIGKSSLLKAMTLLAPPSEAALESCQSLPEHADAIVYLCGADGDDNFLQENLRQFAEQLFTWTVARGQRCEVGDLPLFIVLTKCDLLAKPADRHGDWVERIEEHKQRLHGLWKKAWEDVQAKDQVDSQPVPANNEKQAETTARETKEPASFGTANLRQVWATALKRPGEEGTAAKIQEPYGVAELCRLVLREARDYARRCRRQGSRARGLLALTATLLIGLVLLAGVLIGVHGGLPGTTGKEAQPTGQSSDLLEGGRQLVAEAHKLLRFEDYQKENTPTPWPRWYADADRVTRELASVRGALPEGEEANQLKAEMQKVEQSLRLVQERAALFRLAGDQPLQRPQDKKPPALDISGKITVDQAWTRLNELQEYYPNFQPQPLPDEVPLGIAEELRRQARINYERLLVPARVMIANRVVEISPGGKVTAETWKKFADGWLKTQAEHELAGWRQLALLLALLGGDEQPADPIVQLAAFLQQDRFDLPLARIDVQLPNPLKVGDRILTTFWPEGPLVLRLKSAQGKETVINLERVQQANPAGLNPAARHYAYATKDAALSNGFLVFKPGDEISARLALVDATGRKWLLSWPALLSRSPVYSFEALTKEPFIHPEDTTDYSRAPITFGVHLILSEPRRFALPDLLPEVPLRP